MEVVNGKRIAAEMIDRLRLSLRPKKFLAAVLVGDDKSSISFLAQKEKTAKELGVDFRLYRFPTDLAKDDLRREVGKIAAQTTCGGAIVQLPLPGGVDPQYVLNAIPPEKDADVLSERALGAFSAGRSPVLPPAVGVVEEILRERNVILEASSVAIVGLGALVGRPSASWMMRRAKQTLLLRSTSDLGLLRDADIVITGTGKAGLVTIDFLKEGAGVVDFGYGSLHGKYSGDFDARASGVAEYGGWYTPTPGGTGPVLVAKLFENFYRLASGRKK